MKDVLHGVSSTRKLFDKLKLAKASAINTIKEDDLSLCRSGIEGASR